MFPEQGFVHLSLKLNVSLNTVGNRLRRVRIHGVYHHWQAISIQYACVGFSVATGEVTCPTSFEGGSVVVWVLRETGFYLTRDFRKAGAIISATFDWSS